jgi:hypothetical protein
MPTGRPPSFHRLSTSTRGDAHRLSPRLSTAVEINLAQTVDRRCQPGLRWRRIGLLTGSAGEGRPGRGPSTVREKFAISPEISPSDFPFDFTVFLRVFHLRLTYGEGGNTKTGEETKCRKHGVASSTA